MYCSISVGQDGQDDQDDPPPPRLLYWKFGSSMPYWVGAAFLVVPFFMALRLPPVPESDEETVQP